MLRKNSHRTKHFPRCLCFTQTLRYLLLFLCLSHTNIQTEKDQNHTSHAHRFHSYYSVICTEPMSAQNTEVYMPGTPMQHHETTQRAATESHCIILRCTSNPFQNWLHLGGSIILHSLDFSSDTSTEKNIFSFLFSIIFQAITLQAFFPPMV